MSGFGWQFWVLDVGALPFTEGGIPCFVPVELPETIVWGMSVLCDRCPGILVGVTGAGMSDDEVADWVERHPDWYKRYKNPNDHTMEENF